MGMCVCMCVYRYAAFMWADPVVLRAPIDYNNAYTSGKLRLAADYNSLRVNITTVSGYLSLLTTVKPGTEPSYTPFAVCMCVSVCVSSQV